MSNENQVTKNGMKFWAFPALPYNVSDQVRALLNWYLRTHPETGELDTSTWAVYPNNATPRNLEPLLDLLQDITNQNRDMIDIGISANQPFEIQNERWQLRLNFYKSTVAAMMETTPDVSAGHPDVPGSYELYELVVQPLFLGWFPNSLEPFASQPGPYSSQTGHSAPDLYFPYMMANQTAVAIGAQQDAYDRFIQDLKDRTAMIFTEYLPLMPALGALPWIVVGAIGLAVYGRLK